MFSEQVFVVFGYELPQRLSGKGTIADDALVLPVIRDFPAFGIVGLRTYRLSQHTAKSRSAPANTFEQRFKTDRVHGVRSLQQD